MTNSKPESGHPDENKQDTKKRKQEKVVPFRNANAERQREEDARKADKYITRDGKPPPVTEEVKRLRDLPAADYEQTRKEAAADLGIRVTVLDRFVAEERSGIPGPSMLL